MKRSITIFMFLTVCCLLFTSFSFAQGPPPANDECAGAVTVTTLPFSHSQDTRLATPNGADPSLPCADGGGGKTVWFTFTPDTTRIFTISTRNSTPATYDVALGLFTGSCGSLALEDCNDDIIPGSTRQSELTMYLDSGVTYTIQVAEWKGGGASGGIPTGGDLVFEVFQDTFKPLYAGPKSGSVAGGAIMNTGAFAGLRPGDSPEKQVIHNLPDAPLIQANKGVRKPTGKAGSNLYNDRGMQIQNAASVSQPVVLESFKGMDPTGFIPPDPICAVGPNHVITMVNSNCRIYTKTGILQHEIPLNAWFASVKNPLQFSDPQVLYDHFAGRWIMAGGGFTEPYTFLISVSDDDDPNGVWYNWSLPGGLGDSATGNLPDYPQMGFDDEAIYITSNDFNPTLLYSRVRIIPKAQLYTGSAGPVSWFDIWDFRDPDHRVVPTTALRPSMVYGTPGVHFMVNNSPYNPGTFITVWKIMNPTTAPELTAQNIPVVEYYSAPNANQQGGSTRLLEAGGSAIRHKAVYRDSSLWIAHSIANDSGSDYSAVRYVRMNPYTGVALEDVAMGSDLYWHYYPSLMVDANKNVVITYTLSSSTDYPGVYVAGRKDGDPPGLSPSLKVKAGEGNYQIIANDRNRWGDYSGAALDPVDSLSIWVNGEYSLSTNNWATWVGQIKLAPVSGKYLFGAPLTKTFAQEEVGFVSDTFTVSLQNFGEDAVQISGIDEPTANFDVVDLPSFPVSVALGDTFQFKVVFTPQDTGVVSSVVSIYSDDANHSPMTVDVSGRGFRVIAAQNNTMYMSSGTNDGGKIYTLGATTGSPSLIGISEYSQVPSIRMHPTTHELIGLVPSGANFYLARINSESGDAHPISYVNVPALKGMAFIDDTTLYIGRINGRLYRVNLNSGAATEIANTGIVIAGLAINPVTGKLWASVRNTTGSDNIYKINLPAGTATLVGATGLAQQTQDIVFDEAGNLFGLAGSSSQVNRLIFIDTTTGVGSVIGSTGKTSMLGIAFGPGVSYATTSYKLKASWNMVSLPLNTTGNTLSSVFPSPASDAFTYNGNYVSTTNLDKGPGYWVKFSSAKTHTILGSAYTSDTVDVIARWNMVGSLATQFPTSSVVSVPPVDVTSNYYWYNPDSGYQVATTIQPGKAYWVKTDTSGQLIFDYTLASAKNNVQNNGIDLNTLNVLTVRDGADNVQALYFGVNDGNVRDLNRYELPPAPPAGSFSARFSTNSLVGLHANNKDGEKLSVAINATAFPVTIGWNTLNTAGIKYYLEVTDEQGKKTEMAMKGEGKMVLQNAFSGVRIRAEEYILPEAFALKQNYPNPFNPTTVIRYEMPVDAHVRLSIYDVLGREVTTLLNQEQQAGVYDIQLDATNYASGVYFYSITAEPTENSKGFSRFQSIQKMLLMK